MKPTPARPAKARRLVVEDLESRMVLSGAGTAGALAHAAHAAATQTTLAVGAGTLAQPITFTATVKAPAAAGSPTGAVNLVDHGRVLLSVPLTPSATLGGKATSVATYTLTPQPGGGAYFFGKHPFSAVFVPTGSFAKSSTTRAFDVAQPAYTSLANGVKVATIKPGSGPAIQAGQTAQITYTGYLAKTGVIFDDTSHDGTPLSFAVGGGQVIPGFDAGTLGMQVGETRIILIPASQGYGSKASGPIPANSTLVFVVTLGSIT